jgi:hypothetical protein
MLVLALALTSVPVPFEGPLSDASCRLLSACCSLRVCLRRAWRWCKTPRAFSLRRRRSGSSQHSSWPSGIAKPPASIPSTAAPSKSGRGTQADATPTRVPSPGATAALGVSPTSKVVASAPRSVLTPPTSFSLRSEVAACERRRCELAALSALAAFSICENEATSAAAPAGSTPVSAAAEASLAARDAPPASAVVVSCEPCSVRPLSVAARVVRALASRGESSTAFTRLSTSDAAPPLASVPPLAFCSVVQREAPLMSAWYVTCASSVAWSPSPNARASLTLRIDAASSPSRLPQGTSPTVSLRLTRTNAPQLSNTSPCSARPPGDMRMIL